MNVFVIWFVMVVAWNFGYPEASPLEDVVVAVILSLFSTMLKKLLKFYSLGRKINILIISHCFHF